MPRYALAPAVVAAGAFLVAFACSSFDEATPGDAGGAADVGYDEPAIAPDAAPVDAGPSAYAKAILASQPFVYWRMNIKSGTIVPDETGSGRNLLLQGSGHVLGEPGAIMSDSDRAIRFDGVSSHAGVDDSRLFDFVGTPFTLECWARRDRDVLDGGSTFQHLFMNMEGVSPFRNGYILYAQVPSGPPLTGFEVNRGDAGESRANGPLVPVGAWAHYAAVFDGAKATLYVDGTVALVMVTGALKPRTSQFVISWDPANRGFFPGAIDEIAIYKRALPATEVQMHRDIGRLPQ